MIHYVSTDESGRILMTTPHKEYANADSFEFNFSDDFDFSKQNEYIISKDKLVHDPKHPSEEEIAAKKEQQRQEQLEVATLMFVRTSAATISDNDALNIPLLFEEWSSETHYTKGDICQYEDELYRCLSDHDAQETWTPDQAHSLWVRIRPEGEIREWEQVQPGVNEPYSKGDKVTHNGKTWTSDVDNNVWEPGVYGWTEVTGD